MAKVFIDGSAGTTGLRIFERLENADGIELIKLPEELRKDTLARHDAFKMADISFLCLPDTAATEAVTLAEDAQTAIIDTSTAHRVSGGWTYGFPEIGNQRNKIKSSDRIANPGCHASGFIALIAPLVENGIIPKDALLSCFSLTGYSGGGKKMIAEYENAVSEPLLGAPRVYGLTQQHKHLPEMAKYTGITVPPCFSPIVADFYSGMEVTVPLFLRQMKGSIDDIKTVYKGYYGGNLVFFKENADENGFLSAGSMSGKDSMEISVFGCDDRITLTARYDNLGKGASGSAIQNMNILLGREETAGLVFGGI